ncbi:O-antigen ligase family protein [Actinoplanes sp. URMC 104]|uniref:O-antigen ligase family protein n=1 Tax=Actinoplanes sp. URMC 104 TaxID=3423409 RepID=UPI003F1C9262
MTAASNGLIAFRDQATSRLRLGPQQLVVLLLAAPLLLLGASGWTQRLAFSTPSPIKYSLTVAVPLLLAGFVIVRQRFLVLAAVVVVAAPVATLSASFAGVGFSVLTVVCLLAAVPILLGLTPRVGWSALGRTVPFAAVLAAPSFAHGNAVWPRIQVAITALAVAVICARATQMAGGVSVLLGAGLASLLLEAGIAIWEYMTGSELDAYSGVAARSTDYFFAFADKTRPTGMYFDPISLGTCLSVAVPIGVAALYLLLRRRRWVFAGITTIAVGTIGLGLALTLSRMATLGALASLLVVVAFTPARSRLRVAQIVGTMALLFMAGALIVGGPSLIERASSISDPTAQGVATADGDRDREAYWHVALEAGRGSPVAGVGVGNLNAILLADAPDSGEFTHAHSTYFQIFAESGALGLGALALLAAGLAVDLRRAYIKAPLLATGLIGAVAALAVAALTDIVILKYVPVAATLAPILGIITGLAGQGSDD